MNRAKIDDLLQQGRFVVDGSMSTALEHMGLNLNSSLWTARALIDCPEKVKQVHIDYFKAGADCGITCSYQATLPGLLGIGFSKKKAEKAIADSVRLFLEARKEWWETEGEKAGRKWPLCMAGIGPYGAYLADGSEYHGRYVVPDAMLKDFHKRRAEILYNAGADVLLFETQPNLKEVLIEAEIAEEMQADYIVTFSCRDGVHINDGHRIQDCVKELQNNHPHLKMIGVNCTKPEYVESLIKELKQVTDLPVIVYPNSGEVYDPVSKTWSGDGSGKNFKEYAVSYYEAGATAVGGCCTTYEPHIQMVVEAKEYIDNKDHC